MIILSIIIGVLLLIVGILIGRLKSSSKCLITSDATDVNKNLPYNITSEIVSDGVKNAIREISYEDEQKKIFEKKKRLPDTIYSRNSDDGDVINSGGELIPANLSMEEKQILEMFYSKSD